jgi:succinyl-diaminopimelate desuccinylase
MERIAVGGRGFLRARIDVLGVAAHTGSSRRRGVNAIWRAARLVERIQTAELSAPAAPAFPLPPCMSVTTIEGGQGFSVTPDRCELGLDVRLTPHFDAEAAKALVTSFVAELDARDPGVAATQISWIEGWPAYALDGGVAVVRALHEAAAGVLGRDLPIDVVGPSSVGNFFHAHGVPATNGFGVTCENIHGADERIAVASIAPVYETYRRAITALLPG